MFLVADRRTLFSALIVVTVAMAPRQPVPARKALAAPREDEVRGWKLVEGERGRWRRLSNSSTFVVKGERNNSAFCSSLGGAGVASSLGARVLCFFLRVVKCSGVAVLVCSRARRSAKRRAEFETNALRADQSSFPYSQPTRPVPSDRPAAIKEALAPSSSALSVSSNVFTYF